MGKAVRNSSSKKKKKESPSSSSPKLNRKNDFEDEAFISQEVAACDQFIRDTAAIATGLSSSSFDDVHGLKSGDPDLVSLCDEGKTTSVFDEDECFGQMGIEGGKIEGKVFESSSSISGFRNPVSGVISEKMIFEESGFLESNNGDYVEGDHYFELMAESVINDPSSDDLVSLVKRNSKLPCSVMVEPLESASDALHVVVGGSCSLDARVSGNVGGNRSDLREGSGAVKSMESMLLNNHVGLNNDHGMQKKVGQIVGSAWASSLGLASEGNAMQSGPVVMTLNKDHHYRQNTQQRKKILICPSAAVIAKGMESWDGSLIGHFLDHGLPLHMVKYWAERLWGGETKIDVASLENGFFVFKFGSTVVRDLILKTGPHFFAGKWIIFKLWQPHMTLCKTDLEVVPIWVKFSKVPLLYWTTEGMECLANGFGKFLHVDEASLKGDKLGFAKVCVEISAKEDIPSCMDVELPGGDIVEVKVEIPWKPMKCRFCNVFGHSYENCLQKRKLVISKFPNKAWAPKSVEKQYVREEASDISFPPLGKSSVGSKTTIGKQSDMGSFSTLSKDLDMDACLKDRKVLLNNQKSFLDTVKASLGTNHHHPIMAARRNTFPSQARNSSRTDPPDKMRK